MLGVSIADPHGVEGEPGVSDGLGLLDCHTVLTQAKALRRVSGTLNEGGASVQGYEIHMGVTENHAALKPFAHTSHEDDEPSTGGGLVSDGARSPDDQIHASYIHGLFDSTESLTQILKWAGATNPDNNFDYHAIQEQNLNRLAQTLQQNLRGSDLVILGAKTNVLSFA